MVLKLDHASKPAGELVRTLKVRGPTAGVTDLVDERESLVIRISHGFSSDADKVALRTTGLYSLLSF